MKSCISLFIFLVTALCVGVAQEHVVWIVADDLSPDLGCYGAAGVSTPHLDRLAAEGTRYDRAFATAPVCSSSRSAFILGAYQTRTGLHAHDVENPRPLPPPWRPVTEMLREAGWWVTNQAAPGTSRSGKGVKRGKTHYNFAHDPARMFDGADWQSRPPGKRLFAQFQVLEPHRPFPVPESFDPDGLAAIHVPTSYPDDPLVRRDWYAYLRSVEIVDRRVGEILNQLEAGGMLDRTLVVFFADNGRPMPWGKQWLSREGIQVPLIVRGPGIPAGRVETRPVSLVDLAPSLLAVAELPVPGWMDGRPIFGEGVTFPDREFVFAARDRCGDAVDRIRAIVGGDFLLVKQFHPETPRLNWSSYKEASYPGLPLLRVLEARSALPATLTSWQSGVRSRVELYDLSHDPDGTRDLAADPAQADRVADLVGRLDGWIRDSGDTGALPDPATEPTIAEIQAAKRADYGRVWQSRLGTPEPSDAARLSWWREHYHLSP